MGIIKEVSPTDKDEFGIQEFQERYFPHPVYRDEKRTFYEVLGNRQLHHFISWNPFTAIYNTFAVMNRLSGKDIKGNLKGEGIILGGVFLISPTKGITYTYQEKPAYELPVEDIAAALRKL